MHLLGQVAWPLPQRLTESAVSYRAGFVTSPLSPNNFVYSYSLGRLMRPAQIPLPLRLAALGGSF